MKIVVDMSNQIYKNWKILHRAPPPSHIKNTNSSVWWQCECIECKKQKILNGSEIRANRAGACKCKKKTNVPNNKINNSNKNKTRGKIKDETNNRYVKLLVESFAFTKNGQAYWNCKCDCGNTIVVRGNSLRTGSVQSCGCLRSRKEMEICKILNENKILYKREFSFEDLKDKGKLRFDFAIFDSKNNLIGLIEYQGLQHYEKNHAFNNYGRLQIHDAMKLEYCNNHKIPLLLLNKENIDLSNDIISWVKSLS